MGGFLGKALQLGSMGAITVAGGPLAGAAVRFGKGMLQDALSGGDFYTGLMSGGLSGISGYMNAPTVVDAPQATRTPLAVAPVGPPFQPIGTVPLLEALNLKEPQLLARNNEPYKFL